MSVLIKNQITRKNLVSFLQFPQISVHNETFESLQNCWDDLLLGTETEDITCGDLIVSILLSLAKLSIFDRTWHARKQNGLPSIKSDRLYQHFA